MFYLFLFYYLIGIVYVILMFLNEFKFRKSILVALKIAFYKRKLFVYVKFLIFIVILPLIWSCIVLERMNNYNYYD